MRLFAVELYLHIAVWGICCCVL